MARGRRGASRRRTCCRRPVTGPARKPAGRPASQDKSKFRKQNEPAAWIEKVDALAGLPVLELILDDAYMASRPRSPIFAIQTALVSRCHRWRQTGQPLRGRVGLLAAAVAVDATRALRSRSQS